MPLDHKRYNCYTYCMRFKFDKKKSATIKSNPKRGIGLDEVQEI